MTMRMAGVVVVAITAANMSAGAGGPPPFFDITTDRVQGPAYPTGTLTSHVFNGTPGALTHDADFGMGLRAVSLNGLPPGTPVLGALESMNGDPWPPGGYINSFFDVFVDLQNAPQGQFVDSFFDIFTELSVPGQPSGTTYPVIKWDVPLNTDSFFDIFVEVLLPSGSLPLHLFGQMSPGVRLNSRPQMNFAVDSFFDVFFDITFDRSIYNPGAPAMRMTLDGDIPGPGAVGVLALGGLVAMRRRR